jgi:hypothetical protein
VAGRAFVIKKFPGGVDGAVRFFGLKGRASVQRLCRHWYYRRPLHLRAAQLND